MQDIKELREIYCDSLLEMAATNKDIVVVEADLTNCIKTGRFKAAYPDRFINVGIAEANMIGVCAGLSTCGKIPFCSSFAPFATRRCYDQIFISVAYSKQNVKIVGTDPGITAELNGGTHMPFEDMAIYMAIPEAVVVDPTDYAMLYDITKKLVASEKFSFMRMVRKGIVKVYDDDAEFEIGKGVTLREGKDVTIIASGIMVDEALKAEKTLKAEGISAKVIDMFTWKPIDEELIIKSAEETGCIVTAENHNVKTGLGSAVANVLAKNKPVVMEMVGVEDRFGQVGAQKFLQEEYGLTAENIVTAVKKAIARK